MVTRVKSVAFTATVPVTAPIARHQARLVEAWFGAGADEVLTGLFSEAEQEARISAMSVRTERDVSVHPSTRLPGTTEIEREIRRRLESQADFAVCYADLDHFKEFNDRYSYYDGDRVIYLLSRILHDVVKGLTGSRGFVGHIGGDDFIFIVPGSEIHGVCTEVLAVSFTTGMTCSSQSRAAVGAAPARYWRTRIWVLPLDGVNVVELSSAADV